MINIVIKETMETVRRPRLWAVWPEFLILLIQPLCFLTWLKTLGPLVVPQGYIWMMPTPWSWLPLIKGPPPSPYRHVPVSNECCQDKNVFTRQRLWLLELLVQIQSSSISKPRPSSHWSSEMTLVEADLSLQSSAPKMSSSPNPYMVAAVLGLMVEVANSTDLMAAVGKIWSNDPWPLHWAYLQLQTSSLCSLMMPKLASLSL